MPRRIEVLTCPIARARPTKADIAAALRQPAHEDADFCGKGMMLPIAGCMQPQNLACRTSVRQHVQHRQNRRCPNPRTEKDHRTFSRLENEATTRRTDVEIVP